MPQRALGQKSQCSRRTARYEGARKTRKQFKIHAAPADAPEKAHTPTEPLRFMKEEEARDVQATHGTPAFVYDLQSLKQRAKEVLSFPSAYGLTVRYAMKAAPNRAVLQLFDSLGLHIDASSGYEVLRMRAAGMDVSKASLSSQELPSFFKELMEEGMEVNACSLNQLERIAQACPGAEIGLRFNPGVGSGSTSKTNVGGESSSFGIWHELVPQVKEIVDKHGLQVKRVHTHIGSGSDPSVWQRVCHMSLDLCRQFEGVHTLNLGGGQKVARMSEGKSVDLQQIGQPIKDAFENFAAETGRKLHLELEPGTYLVANSCSLVSTVQDMTTTGPNGYNFIKSDTGMTEIIRPAMYGAQHPTVVVKADPSKATEEAPPQQYIVAGHCCEASDMLTPEDDAPEVLSPRYMQPAETGDVLVIEGVGSYCSSMSSKHYNSFPECAELLRDADGTMHTIRKRQPVEELWQHECDLPA